MRTIVAILLVAGATIFTASGTVHATGRTPDITMHSHRSSGPRYHAVTPGHRSSPWLIIIAPCAAPTSDAPIAERSAPGAIELCLPRAGMVGRHLGVVSV